MSCVTSPNMPSSVRRMTLGHDWVYRNDVTMLIWEVSSADHSKLELGTDLSEAHAHQWYLHVGFTTSDLKQGSTVLERLRR